MLTTWVSIFLLVLHNHFWGHRNFPRMFYNILIINKIKYPFFIALIIKQLYTQ